MGRAASAQLVQKIGFNPRQQKKSGIVEYPTQTGLATRRLPADPAVARRHLPSRRSEADGTEHPMIAMDQVTQLGPRQRGVVQGVSI